MFWGARKPQNECLAKARCYFSKNPVFQARCGFGLIFYRFLTDFGLFLDRKTHPKMKQKLQQILNDFLMDSGTHFGSKWGPCWLHFRLQKIIEILLRFSAPLADLSAPLPRLIAYPHISRYIHIHFFLYRVMYVQLCGFF